VVFFFKLMTLKVWLFFFLQLFLEKLTAFVKFLIMGQRKRHPSDFSPVGLRLWFFREVGSSGGGLISWSCHLLLIPSEGCVVNAFCYSPVTSPSAYCPNHCSCSVWLSHRTFSGGACPLDSVVQTGLSLVPSHLLSCSCSVELLSSCAASIPHHLSCHSGRLCLGPGCGGWGATLG